MVSSSAEESEQFRQRQALIAAANANDIRAQSKLGDCYRVGDEFTEQDYVAAIKWYRLAAQRGDPGARNNLGSMYLNGMGVPADAVQAVKWYRLAAEQELPTAQFNLALRYLHGSGVEQDDHAAAEWLRKAAVQGHTESIGELGTLYRFGRGVEHRIATAADLHVIAALEGDLTSIGNLADYRPEIECEAVRGSLLAALCLAKMFDRGLGVESCKVKMLAWLLWGEQHGGRDDNVEARSELEDMKRFYSLVLSASDKVAAEKLFNQMLASVAGDERIGDRPIPRRLPFPLCGVCG